MKRPRISGLPSSAVDSRSVALTPEDVTGRTDDLQAAAIFPVVTAVRSRWAKYYRYAGRSSGAPTGQKVRTTLAGSRQRTLPTKYPHARS